MNGRGKFITFEGVEGSGKSTQINLCSQFLMEKGIPFIKTRQPGDTVIGRKLRAILLDPDNTHMDPLCEAHLYMADRAQHLAELIVPSIEKGLWVLCDRYHDSTLAYQGYARGMNSLSYEGFLKPDRTFLLVMDPLVGLTRARMRNEELNLAKEARFENEELEFHQRVQQGFMELAQLEPQRIAKIDAQGEPETVFSRIRHLLLADMEQDRV